MWVFIFIANGTLTFSLVLFLRSHGVEAQELNVWFIVWSVCTPPVWSLHLLMSLLCAAHPPSYSLPFPGAALGGWVGWLGLALTSRCSCCTGQLSGKSSASSQDSAPHRSGACASGHKRPRRSPDSSSFQLELFSTVVIVHVADSGRF